MTRTRGKAKSANGEGGITYREDGRYMGRYTVQACHGAKEAGSIRQDPQRGS